MDANHCHVEGLSTGLQEEITWEGSLSETAGCHSGDLGRRWMQPGEKYIFLCVLKACIFAVLSQWFITWSDRYSMTVTLSLQGKCWGEYFLATVSYPWVQLNSAVLANFSHALISSWLTLAIHRKGHQETVTGDICPWDSISRLPFTEPILLPCMLEGTPVLMTLLEEGCGISLSSIHTHLGLAFQSLNKYYSMHGWIILLVTLWHFDYLLKMRHFCDVKKKNKIFLPLANLLCI